MVRGRLGSADRGTDMVLGGGWHVPRPRGGARNQQGAAHDGKRTGRRQPQLPQPFSLLPRCSWRGGAPRAAERHPNGGSRLLLPATHRSPLGLQVTPGPSMWLWCRTVASSGTCPARSHVGSFLLACKLVSKVQTQVSTLGF